METAKFCLFAANRKRKCTFVFLSQQVINGNQWLLFQKTFPSMFKRNKNFTILFLYPQKGNPAQLLYNVLNYLSWEKFQNLHWVSSPCLLFSISLVTTSYCFFCLAVAPRRKELSGLRGAPLQDATCSKCPKTLYKKAVQHNVDDEILTKQCFPRAHK